MLKMRCIKTINSFEVNEIYDVTNNVTLQFQLADKKGERHWFSKIYDSSQPNFRTYFEVVQYDKQRFINFMYDVFPTVFISSFAREILDNILEYAETLGSPEKQYKFLVQTIPEVSEEEIKSNLWGGTK